MPDKYISRGFPKYFLSGNAFSVPHYILIHLHFSYFFVILVFNGLDNFNLFMDIKILFLTVLKVIKKDGINQEGNATMEKFTGNN